jgi:hypothetical protein
VGACSERISFAGVKAEIIRVKADNTSKGVEYVLALKIHISGSISKVIAKAL